MSWTSDLPFTFTTFGGVTFLVHENSMIRFDLVRSFRRLDDGRVLLGIEGEAKTVTFDAPGESAAAPKRISIHPGETVLIEGST